LVGELIAGKNTALVLAILKALEQIGDEKAVRYVEKVALGKTKTSKNEAVRIAAAECLEFLNRHKQNQGDKQILLRSSSVPPAAPQELLRPAQSVAETEPRQLLRATSSEETE
jgi:hypothetical protein